MKPVKYVNFIARRSAERIHQLPAQLKRVGLVSITNPDLHDADLYDVWHDVLRLKFHDVDRQNNEGTLRIFTEDHADQVLSFLHRNEDTVDGFITHCEAGVSRSAAVAKFIAHIYVLPFPENYPLYNRLVFSTLLKRYHERRLDGDGPLPGVWTPE